MYDVTYIPQEDGTCIEEVRLPFEPNVVIRRVVPCPKAKETRTDGVTNEPSVHVPTVSNSLTSPGDGPSRVKEGSDGQSAKKKRKGKKVRRVPR